MCTAKESACICRASRRYFCCAGVSAPAIVRICVTSVATRPTDTTPSTGEDAADGRPTAHARHAAIGIYDREASGCDELTPSTRALAAFTDALERLPVASKDLKRGRGCSPGTCAGLAGCRAPL